MEMIIHEDCGLPVEFCDCADAEVYYDWVNDTFVRDMGYDKLSDPGWIGYQKGEE